MANFFKDIYLGYKLLIRRGHKAFVYRLYWYIKGKRLYQDIPGNEPQPDMHPPAVTEKIEKIPVEEHNKYVSARVLFVSHDAFLAGAQVLLINLIEWFVKNTSWKIKIICLEGGVLAERFESLAPTLFWPDVYTNISDPGEKKKIIREFAGEIDLVYENTVVSSRITPFLKALDAPIIAHVHELEITISTLLDQEKLNSLHQLTSAYIACSPAVADNLKKNHFDPPKPITTINAFIKPAVFTDLSKSEVKKDLGLKQGRFTVFGCGTLDWRKGTDLFVDAAIETKKRGYEDFQFYWIGRNTWDKNILNDSDVKWADIEQKIDLNGVSDNIEFLGVKDNPREYFMAGDCFFLSSREDPFPLVALEAAESRLPVICFEDAGGMPGFVEDDAGFVIPFEDVAAVVDRITHLIEDPDNARKLGEAARNKVLQNHTLQIAAPQILQFCQEVGKVKPALSIIVPNYNYENYLPQRLDSIINQTFKDFELIILDDASSDNSMEIIRKYEQIPNVRIIASEKNSGNAFHQWKKGLEAARSDIVWIAEADDYAEPEFIESLIDKFADPDVALAYCNSHIVNENGEITRDYKEYYDMLDENHWRSDYIVDASTEINFGLGVKNSIPNVSAVLMRKSLLRQDILNQALSFKLSGDWFIYVSMLHRKKIAFKNQKLNYHRKHSKTQTTSAHQSENKSLILSEAERIHNLVLQHYRIKNGFHEKWDRYVDLQIRSLYPEAKRETFNNFYPYGEISSRIKELTLNPIPQTAIIVTHSAGRTGAPLIIYSIARHLYEKDGIECIVFSLDGGPLMDDFRKTGPAFVVKDNILQGKNMTVSEYLKSLDEKPAFALVNTACCGKIIPEIKSAGIPLVTLIHDYTYAFNKNYLKTMYDFTDQIVYSTDFMVKKNINDYTFDLEKTSVIPQGLYKTDFLERDQQALRKEFRKKLNIPEDAFVVLGSGFVHPRKGVDIFIMTAIQVVSDPGNTNFHFVWIGGKLDSNSPEMYIRFLHRDLVNSGTLDKIHFVGMIDDVLPYYALSDLLFLSSREDPFPTIVMESFAVGNPVIGMEGSSGSIELLRRTDNFVAPYGNIASIAMMIREVAENKDLREQAAIKGKKLVMEEFNFDHYVVRLKKLLINELNVDERLFTYMEKAGTTIS